MKKLSKALGMVILAAVIGFGGTALAFAEDSGDPQDRRETRRQENEQIDEITIYRLIAWFLAKAY